MKKLKFIVHSEMTNKTIPEPKNEKSEFILKDWLSLELFTIVIECYVFHNALVLN